MTRVPFVLSLARIATLVPALAATPLHSQERPYVGREVALGASIREFELGDVNADGAIDAVVATTSACQAWLGDGNGGFALAGASNCDVYDIELGDLDGDSDLDVVGLDHLSPDLVRIDGNGAGQLAPAQVLITGFTSTVRGVRAADMDGDSDVDLVAVADSYEVRILANDGAGNFSVVAAVTPAQTPFYRELELSDFDGDGALDAVFGHYSAPTSSLLVLRGTGSGGFHAPVLASLFASTVDQLRRFALADFDGDGDADVALTTQQPGLPAGWKSAVLENLGGAGFSTWPSSGPVNQDRALRLADVDGNGRPDVTLVDERFTLTIDLNPAFSTPFSADISLGAGDTPPRWADLDADGDLDVLSWYANRLIVLQASAPAQFDQVESPSSVSAFQLWGSADFDADGDVDLIRGQQVLWNDGAAAFVVGPSLLDQSVADVSTGDVDGNGTVDLVSIPTYGNAGVHVVKNIGGGAFAPHVAFTSLNSLSECELADLEGDGDLDVVVARTGSLGKLTTLRNDGTGSFGSSLTSDTGVPIGDLWAGDLDGDGFADAVCAHGSQWSVRWGSPTGALGAPVFTSATGACSAIEVADFDEDGRLDIAYSAYNSLSLYILRQTAPRTFSAGSPLAIPAGLEEFQVFDRNSDGKLDLLAADVFASFHLLTQNAVAGFTLDGRFFLGYDPYATPFRTGDFDGDGFVDIASSTRYELRVSLHRGPDAPAAYCIAKVNSQGCVPAIGSSGSPSASSIQPFTISAVQVLNNKSGLLFYGLAPSSAPFQGGTKCVATPTVRTPVQSSNGNAPPDDCSGVFNFDFNARIQSSIDPALAPTVFVYSQWWYRDPATASTTGLSDGLAFQIGP